MRRINVAEPFIEDEEIAAVTQVLKEKRLSQGKYVEKFENSFAEYVGTNHGIAFNSGTAALQVGLAANDIKPNDEIITSPFTFKLMA